MTRTMRSDYMHWAKNQPKVTFNLGSSEVDNFRLDRLPFEIADLELDGASYHRYPPLRQAIAEKEQVTPEQVVMADGTSMANMLALAALIDPGDEVLVEEPVYEPMLATVRYLGGEVRRFERRAEEGFRLDPDAVERQVGPRTRLILVTNLHNPSGAFADEAALERIGAIGPRVVVDEVYRDAVPGSRSAAHLGSNFIVTNSLTKVYGLSGLRCGWILADPDLAERMWRLNELFGVAQAHAAERLSCIALAHLDEVASGTAERLERNRALARDFLDGRPELDWVPVPHGITLFPRLVRGDVDRLRDLLVEKYDASIVPGRWFERPDHFRLGIGAPPERFTAGLERLGSALDELSRT
ncbi:pyridoxal phosphate-dependent aminotransferase [Sphingosinicella sp. CPCC 101087]|uniref:pyridoxal phosphate-dependent aminotransferase n=1 Tax=Sphingosinicella sp. CPCC 101087 TaxID=2497754 RepID=UPI00101DBCDD|nr:pyridoxal phosphate-dependent aminotransferase [Sphingosinicella sp. CPCC 101087]